MLSRFSYSAFALFLLVGFVANAEPLPVVAIHRSIPTRASGVWPYVRWKVFHPIQFLEEALRADGITFVEVTDSQIDNGALLLNGKPKYPILFSIGAEGISDVTASSIAVFAWAGGHVYVSGSSWTRLADGSPRFDSSKRPTMALANAVGITTPAWFLTSGVTTPSSLDLRVNHLMPSSSYDWEMPARYDFLDVFHNHWVFAARPAPGTEVILGAKLPATAQGRVQPFSIEFLSSSSDNTDWAGATPLPSLDIRFGDVNGDGRLDLAVRVGRNVKVGLSTGQGFAPLRQWTTWETNYDWVLTDANGDRKADIVGKRLSGSLIDIQVGLSTGSQFAASSSWTGCPTTICNNTEMKFADINGDGRSDMVTRIGATLNLFLSSSACNSGCFLSLPPSIWSPAFDFSLGDVNGDGKADIVGRSGTSIHVGLSTGTTFNVSTQWTTWNTAYDYRLADMDGDKRADLVGRSSMLDVQVALSGGSAFFNSTSWASWGPTITDPMYLADVTGDLRADFVGHDASRHVVFSPTLDSPSVSYAKLTSRPYGLGRFVFNAELNPMAGYGGFSNDNSEYKIIRRSIDQAFNAQALPVITIGAWPSKKLAAAIYRHDHWMASDVHALEIAFGSSITAPFGEYYVLPNQANCSNTPVARCIANPTNDLLVNIGAATSVQVQLGM